MGVRLGGTGVLVKVGAMVGLGVKVWVSATTTIIWVAVGWGAFPFGLRAIKTTTTRMPIKPNPANPPRINPHAGIPFLGGTAARGGSVPGGVAAATVF